ncbi:Os01g0949140, partial [Oryza sativa Japonica Group]
MVLLLQVRRGNLCQVILEYYGNPENGKSRGGPARAPRRRRTGRRATAAAARARRRCRRGARRWRRAAGTRW